MDICNVCYGMLDGNAVEEEDGTILCVRCADRKFEGEEKFEGGGQHTPNDAKCLTCGEDAIVKVDNRWLCVRCYIQISRDIRYPEIKANPNR